MAGMGVLNRLVQAAFRVRNDDGVESLSESNGGATQIGADNTNWEQETGVPFRLRILTTHALTGTSAQVYVTLRYSHNGGAYTQVSNASSVVRTTVTSYWTNLDNSTEFVGRLGVGTWFNNLGVWGALIDNADIGSDAFSSYFSCGSTQERELETEWCIELVDGDLSPGDTIDFRMYGDGGPVYSDGYTFTPRATVPTATPPTITNTPATTTLAEADYAEQMTASGGATPYVWSFNTVPDGATIDSATGLIRWVPTEAQIGETFLFQCLATGADDLYGALQWQVTVDPIALRGIPKVDPAIQAGREARPTQTLASEIVPALGGKVEIS